MVLRIQMTIGDLGRLRFAISPLWEAVSSLRVLREPERAGVNAPWAQRHWQEVGSARSYGLLHDLVMTPERLLLGFLAPTPAVPLGSLRTELASVARTDVATVRRELDELFPRACEVPAGVAWARRAPRAAAVEVARQLDRYWHATLEATWERCRGVLESEVTLRARQLADRGPSATIHAIDPRLRWDDGWLTVDSPTVDGTHELRGRGIVLVPSVFASPNVFVKTSEPWQPVIRYPCRGIADVWLDDRRSRRPDLAAALGSSRATLLDALDAPATTSILARRTGLAASGVSAHLARLSAARLVERQRIGREVYYARSARGENLVQYQ